MLPHAGLAEFHTLRLYSSLFHCVSSPPFSPSNVWVTQYSDASTFAQIPAWGDGNLSKRKLCSNFQFHSDTSRKDLRLGHRKYHIYNSLCLHDTVLIVAGLEDKYTSCCVSCWVSLDLPSGCSKRKERKNKVHPSPDSEGIMTASSPDWPNAFQCNTLKTQSNMQFMCDF